MNSGYKRIVVKIGTGAMMKNGKVNRAMIKSMALELSGLRLNGMQVLLVSSGAIGFGMEKMSKKFPRETVLRQAMAAVGQNILMYEYEKQFSKFNQTIAQVLVTPNSFSEKSQLQNLQNTVESLFSLNVIPIFNENDVVATDALSEGHDFSDNDGLAALAAISFGADLLVILTDVDGVFTDNPKENNSAEKISGQKELLEKPIRAGEKSSYGLGGVKSKILAAKKVLSNGINVAICMARNGAVVDVIKGKCSGSFFLGGKQK